MYRFNERLIIEQKPKQSKNLLWVLVPLLILVVVLSYNQLQ